jgi:succinylglutamic semialdehyde dehydrogenase
VEEIKFRGDLIGGEFTLPERVDGQFLKQSPADLSDTILRVEFSYDHIDQAVKAARKAFADWSMLQPSDRVAAVMRVKEELSKRADEMAEVISRETGKPLWESKTEVNAMLNKFDITKEHSLKHVADVRLENALPKVDGYVRYRARGVMVVLGPFNFPGHLPNGHFVPALMTGNTVVFKPSEFTPATGQILAEIFSAAGLPTGVFNLVHGGGETGSRLADHHGVDGVLFTGSYDVGLKIKEKTLTHFWKILALEMGGKNATMVWEDADLNKAIFETLQGSFLTAGQRCSCTARIILHRKIAQEFTERFYEAAKKIRIGHWSRDDVFMGPLISEKAVEKYLRFQEIAQREGAEKVMRGKVFEAEHRGHYVTPSIYKVAKYDPSSVYQKSEIFGPNVCLYEVDDLDEAIAINDGPQFGLVASVFTKDRKNYERVLQRARVGLVNWNRTTNGASSKLPFGGLGKSGNDRPAADFAVYYCTVPVASLEDVNPFDTSAKMPGLEFTPR